MDLGTLFQQFPDFFRSIVKTTSEFGPVAFGILLLAVLIFLLYQFRGSLRNNPLLQYGVNGLALLAGCLLLLFIYQAFQFYLKSAAIDPIVLVQGTITYQLPDQNGDLDFDVQGIDSRSGGDVSAHFYSYNKYLTERRILGIAKPDTLEIRVSNRQVYRACNEDSPKVGTRNKRYYTDYQISLKDAYMSSIPVVDGIAQYGIDFDYKSRNGSPERDFLRITQFHGIDASKVKVVRVHHEPDSCVDAEQKTKYAQVVISKTVQQTPQLAAVRSVLAALRDALVSAAYGTALQVDKKSVFDFLNATDSSLAFKAMSEIAAAPASFTPMIADLLKRTDAKSATAQANVLVALENAKPKPYRLPDTVIPEVVELSYAGPAEVRQAARSYLTDANIVDERIVKTVSKINAAHRNGNSLDSTRDLLLLITAREVYYAAGVQNMVDYVGNWGKAKRVPAAINQSIADFQLGIDLVKAVPAAKSAPFAKSYYGMALALRSRAVVNAAVAQLGNKATSHQIDQQVTALVNKSAQLPFTHRERKAFIGTIDNFLALVKSRENEYFWPQHIAKMKSCRAKQTYDCLRVE